MIEWFCMKLIDRHIILYPLSSQLMSSHLMVKGERYCLVKTLMDQ